MMSDSSSSPAPPPPPIDTAPLPRGALSITPNLLTADRVDALRADGKALYAAGAFVPGGLRRRRRYSDNDNGGCSNNNNGNGDHTNGRNHNSTKSNDKLLDATTETAMADATDDNTRICDVCGLFDDAERQEMQKVGNREAREDLFDFMADLRGLLQGELDVKLSEEMELQYLRYPGSINNGSSGDKSDKIDKKKKGFYGRHFDSASDDETTRRRKVSLLLYLNEDGWDGKKDGGVLRAYVKRAKKKSGDGSNGNIISVQDVVPEGGKLVLFDSKSVEHEVLPTCKERWAVVGWFLSDESASNRRGNNVSGEKRKQSRNNTGNEQARTKKKKKRRRGR